MRIISVIVKEILGAPLSECYYNGGDGSTFDYVQRALNYFKTFRYYSLQITFEKFSTVDIDDASLPRFIYILMQSLVALECVI